MNKLARVALVAFAVALTVGITWSAGFLSVRQVLAGGYMPPPVELASFTVTNTNDSGIGSLRKAIEDANANPGSDTISFSLGPGSHDILLTSGQLFISDDLTINGPGQFVLTINGNNTGRVFEIGIGKVAIISELAITNGAAGLGGGIYNNHATLTLNNCLILGNRADFGGGIYNDGRGAPATLTVNNCWISVNTGNQRGAGLYNSSSSASGNASMTIHDSIIDNNSSPTGGGMYSTADNDSSIGGAAVLTIKNSTVNGNTSGNGGGVYIDGLPNGLTTSLDVQDSTFSGNTGGAIVNENSNASIINSSIVNSTGTGIYNHIVQAGLALTLDKTTISNNSVGGIQNLTEIGAITLMINNSTISGNSADSGGGIANFNGSMSIANSRLSGNTADNNGGGLWIGNSGPSRTVTISNSTFSQNTAGQNGGGVYLLVTSMSGSTTVTVAHSTFSGNSAPIGGGISSNGPFNNANVTLAGTVLNRGPFGANLSQSFLAPITSIGYNLSSDDGAGRLTSTGDQINTDPMLGPLQNNGGPTFTHALLPGSLARNNGDPNFAPPPLFDQRGGGFPRVASGRIDIGSFEAQTVGTPTPTATPTATPTPEGCFALITQTASQQVGSGLACSDPVTGFTAENHYWRAFSPSAHGIGPSDVYTISSVDVGIALADSAGNGTTQPLTVNLYTADNFPGSISLIGTSTVQVADVQSGMVINIPLSATVPVGTGRIVMEVMSPDGLEQGNVFQMGANDSSETGPSYISAPACGLTNPVTTADIGSPQVHWVMNLRGACPTPNPTPVISGRVTYENAAAPVVLVPGVSLDGSGSPAVSGLTDSTGQYTLTGFGPGPYTVTPAKPKQLFTTSNGITVNDAAQIARHIVGLTSLSPTQQKAALVSGGTVITSLDAGLIAQYIVGIPSAINQTGRWKFTPIDRTYASIMSTQINQDYAAILMGDVSGDWAAPAMRHGAMGIQELALDLVTASIPDVTAAASKEVVIPVRLDNTAGRAISSYQFTILFDPNVIKPQSTAASLVGTLAEGMKIVYHSSSPGTLNVAVYGAFPMTGDGVYAELKFRGIGPSGSSTAVAISKIQIGESGNSVSTLAGRVSLK